MSGEEIEVIHKGVDIVRLPRRKFPWIRYTISLALLIIGNWFLWPRGGW